MRGAARQFVLALCALLASAGASAQSTPWDNETGKPYCGMFMSPAYSSVSSARVKSTSIAAAKYYMDQTYAGQNATYAGDEAGEPSTFTYAHKFQLFSPTTGASYGYTTANARQIRADNPAGGIWSNCTVYVEPAPECTVPAGTKKFVEFPIGSYFPDGTCASSCRWTRDAVGIGLGGTMTYAYTNSGESCTDPENTDVAAAPAADNDSEFDNCTTTGGNTLCYTDNRTNCGEVNGEYVCLPSAPDACSSGAGGGKVCGPTSSTPPAPDDGRPGVPADPDAVIPVEEGAAADGTGGTTTNNYYYNNGTVSGSSNQTPGEGGDPLCNSATDANCVDSGKEWVDRDYKPPGLPELPTDPFAEYDPEAAWGSGYGAEGQGQASGFVNFLSTTFPFSLAFSGPLAMMSTGSSTPQFSYTAAGHTASASMGMWDDLFALVRVVSGVLLIFGVYLLALATISTWAR